MAYTVKTSSFQLKKGVDEAALVQAWVQSFTITTFHNLVCIEQGPGYFRMLLCYE